MTKGLDSKIKIAIGNHEAYEEEGPIGEVLKKSIMDHYGLDKSYYSFDYRNVHVLVLDTQLELSVDTLKAAAIINDTSIKNKEQDKDKPNHKKENPLLQRYPTIDIKDFIEKNSINVKDPSLEQLEEKNAQVPALEFDKGQYQFVLMI